MQRRTALCMLLTVGAVTGCGFHLRTPPQLAFQTVAVTPERGTGVAAELSRYFGDALRPAVPPAGGKAPEVIVDILEELREKNVVGVNASGQVREFQLRIKVRFRVRTPQGAELIAPSEIAQQRDISFNESAVLAKETEESLLYRDMQTDLVQQLLRRLAAIKSLSVP